MGIFDSFFGSNEEKDAIPEVPKTLKDVLSFTVDGKTAKVHILASRKGDPLLLSWLGTLEKNGFKVNKIYADAEIISRQNSEIRHTSSGEIDTRTLNKIRHIFQIAASRKASDIHILSEESYANVMIRINGSLARVLQMPSNEAESIFRTIYQGGIAIADSGYKPHEYQAGQVTDRHILPDTVASIRIQRGPMMSGRFMVLRLLYNGLASKRKISNDGITPELIRNPVSLDEGILEFTKFGFTHVQSMVLAMAARKPAGMVIFSGPTGSGKSSALQRALAFQARLYPEKAIYTIEDPPEYPIAGSRQLPVLNAANDAERARKFQEALKVAMRSDPDILMVGEIRDPATASTALDATITGHQMWTTIHALDAFLIPTRLLRMGLDRQDLMDPSVLTALVAQRLVARLCSCSVDYYEGEEWLDSDIRERILMEEDGDKRVRIRNPSGCEKCRDTPGISSRILVSEVVPVTQKLLNVFMEGSSSSAREWYRENAEDPMLMPDHGWSHVLSGIVDPRDMIAMVSDPPPPKNRGTKIMMGSGVSE